MLQQSITYLLNKILEFKESKRNNCLAEKPDLKVDLVNFKKTILRFEFNDGCAENAFSAFEFKPIKFFKLDMPLGLKVLLKPSLIRRGIILLEEKNMVILGGHVPEFNAVPILIRLENKFRSSLGHKVESYETGNIEDTFPIYPQFDTTRIDMEDISNTHLKLEVQKEKGDPRHTFNNALLVSNDGKMTTNNTRSKNQQSTEWSNFNNINVVDDAYEFTNDDIFGNEFKTDNKKEVNIDELLIVISDDDKDLKGNQFQCNKRNIIVLSDDDDFEIAGYISKLFDLKVDPAMNDINQLVDIDDGTRKTTM
ncbi:hypothetical protein HK099_000042 [Clydaea vesicula]|uniref:RecQ-mediated genome instability protein 1 n=1 Tax=Clydaea vesicula TaxID=447962 RepID=A0AAD5UBU5_9FUNG|nr:hypothetical protein HK099_000042 [Clydaea vesicula]